ncbi:hypothetical protein [uncultured Rikenella sp.]|uniref:hypothetical protein n=1 Tax=uncultured Rikenella sp. TaxID=368003 RepID=UPI002612326C|nr:hypothetical protein [uncultured Rikenella sp.]
MRSISRPRDVGPARPEGSTLLSAQARAPPKEGNRQNVQARFDKISQGARTKNGVQNSVASPRKRGISLVLQQQNRDEIPASDEKRIRAPRLKKRFNYFGGEPK